MIEINLDSKNRKNNKIIIDGENICEKYQVTGFNLSYQAKNYFPILSVDFLGEDIKIISDSKEVFLNKKKQSPCEFIIGQKIDNNLYQYNLEDYIRNLEYKSWENGEPKELKITLDYKLFNQEIVSEEFKFKKGQEISATFNYKNNITYYNCIIEEIKPSENQELLYLFCKRYDVFSKE